MMYMVTESISRWHKKFFGVIITLIVRDDFFNFFSIFLLTRKIHHDCYSRFIFLIIFIQLYFQLLSKVLLRSRDFSHW